MPHALRKSAAAVKKGARYAMPRSAPRCPDLAKARAQLPTHFTSHRHLADDCTQPLLSDTGQPRARSCHRAQTLTIDAGQPLLSPCARAPRGWLLSPMAPAPRFLSSAMMPGPGGFLREVLMSALSAPARSEISLQEVPACPALKFLYARRRH